MVSVQPATLHGIENPVVVALPDLWGALLSLGSRDRKLEWLAGQLGKTVMSPLLEHFRKLEPGRVLRQKLHSPNPDLVVWTWVEEDLGAANEEEGKENCLPPPQQPAAAAGKQPAPDSPAPLGAARAPPGVRRLLPVV